jgi:bifunctional UDP-N-acetylglucosamine pyrophosphorylase/glucosamine-1-phosphate N-acetyltransferase
MTVSAIVLAAGDGSRMRSARPKPLHMICGRAMVMHVIHALDGIAVDRTIVVVGQNAERVTKKVQEQAPGWASVTFVEQSVPRGSGDAVLVGLSAFDFDDLDDTSTVVVLPADTPLLRPDTVSTLVARHESTGEAATVLTVRRPDPTGYRRVERATDKHGAGPVIRLVDHRSASAAQLDLDECSTSVFAFRRDLLGPSLRRVATGVGSSGGTGGIDVADVIEALAALGHRVGALEIDDLTETQNVNDRWQLAMVERELRNRTNRQWLLNGVTMLDPGQTFIDVTVQLGRDVTLYPGTILQGRTVVGNSCEIGPDTRLVDCVVGRGATVQNTVAVEAEIGAGAVVGPFAHLAPGATIDPGVRTGPFYTGHSD